MATTAYVYQSLFFYPPPFPWRLESDVFFSLPLETKTPQEEESTRTLHLKWRTALCSSYQEEARKEANRPSTFHNHRPTNLSVSARRAGPLHIQRVQREDETSQESVKVFRQPRSDNVGARPSEEYSRLLDTDWGPDNRVLEGVSRQ